MVQTWLDQTFGTFTDHLIKFFVYSIQEILGKKTCKFQGGDGLGNVSSMFDDTHFNYSTSVVPKLSHFLLLKNNNMSHYVYKSSFLTLSGEIISLPLQSGFQKHLFCTWTLQMQKEEAAFKSIKAVSILLIISKLNKSL